MSEAVWAPIVYGRSFHLDFRFITIPEDFGPEDLEWSTPYILATTHQARNLSKYPRWSLFRNNTHCIIGITCMVRDLIGQSEKNKIQSMVKDDHGRPLYMFAGYATQLNQETNFLKIPAYTGMQIDTFKPLYQQVKQVWLVKDYESASKHPHLSKYQTLNSVIKLIDHQSDLDIEHPIQLNHDRKSPKQIFSWPDSPHQNNQLWLEATNCLEATSICLGVKGKLSADSPFLNQTASNIEEFTICDRLKSGSKSNHPNSTQSVLNNNQDTKSALLFSQKISYRAKSDLNLTLEQAMKIAAASQELINQMSDHGDSQSMLDNHSKSNLDESENFGFKTKESQVPSKKQDWF